ncbi:MAG: sugar phosphate isomerase/epimerase [Lachnospiraceae bacterium]|nr:sugar phosphate isomerase/epimerase [Lachnospiraceae bacterium]
MNIVCASSGLVWHKSPKKGILNVRDGGFEAIMLDLSGCCSAGELEDLGKERKISGAILNHKKEESVRISEHPEQLCSFLQRLFEECKKESIRIPAARAPYLNRNTKRKDLGELLTRLAKESIRASGQAGCKYLIVRPLFSGIERGSEWEANRIFYLGLADLAKQNDVMILLENQCLDVNGSLNRGICAESDEAVSWVDRLNAECGEERFGFCMDVGVCNLCGQNMREFAVSLGSRIKAVILRDCDGIRENAMLPFTCVDKEQFRTDWQNLIRGLREICFDGLLIMDFKSMTTAFSRFLRPGLIKFAQEIAEFFRWQIGMKSVLKKYDTRVLFGAGNMCRNYMKCYGREFPPLFTCDNNSARWGEIFEGLQIRPPETLKDLASDCAIFICNIYYREIEEQLRKMGIANPIEYFNDEYMPSFYFDRLEYWERETTDREETGG